MNLKKTRLLAGLLLALLFLSCGKEKYDYGKKDDENGEPVKEGALLSSGLALSVDTSYLDITHEARAQDPGTDQFIIRITNAKTSAVEGTWIKSEMPAKITLRTGKYTLEAFSPGTLVAAAWESPYFQGKTEFEIKDGQNTAISGLICKIQNMLVSVSCSENFLKQVLDYHVTVSNRTGTLDFRRNELRIGYFTVAPLIISVMGTRDDGVSFSYPIVVSKVNAADWHRIHVDMAMSGTLQPNITIDVTTNNKDIDISIPGDDDIIVDPDPEPDPDPTPDPEPEVKLPVIEGVGFDITKNITLRQGDEKAVNVAVKAENGGIKTLKVTIISPDLEALLPSVGLGSVLDLTNPGSMKEALKSLGLITDAPVKDEKSYSFSVGKFMPLLPAGTHKFRVDLVDNGGNSETQTMTIIVTE